MISFSKTSVEKAASTIEKLETRREKALEALEDARERYGTALLMVEDGAPKAKEEIDLAKANLARVESVLQDSETAIEAAKKRYDVALRQKQKNDEGNLWDQVEKLGDRRLLLAEKVEKDAKSFAAHLEELSKLGVEQFNLAPGVKEASIQSTTLDPSFINNLARQHLFRHGCKWAFKWPWGISSIPDFTSQIVEGNEWLLKHRQN